MSLTIVAYDDTRPVFSRVAEDEPEAIAIASKLFQAGIVAEVLGGAQSCNRCGACCEHGPRCTLRPALGKPRDYTGRCELLRDNPDGSTTCEVIEHLEAKHPEHLPLWITLTGRCNYPHLRRELLQISQCEGHL
jgi:hypothetical protein